MDECNQTIYANLYKQLKYMYSHTCMLQQVTKFPRLEAFNEYFATWDILNLRHIINVHDVQYMYV